MKSIFSRLINMIDNLPSSNVRRDIYYKFIKDYALPCQRTLREFQKHSIDDSDFNFIIQALKMKITTMKKMEEMFPDYVIESYEDRLGHDLDDAILISESIIKKLYWMRDQEQIEKITSET